MNTMNAAEKIAQQQAQAMTLTTKNQVEKVMKINGVFYAKTNNRGSFIGSITYNDVMVYRGCRDNILKIVLQCCRCEDDGVVDTQEFHLLQDGWHQVSVYGIDDGYYRAITDEDLEEMPWYWVSVRNADEDFRAYVNNLFKILR